MHDFFFFLFSFVFFAYGGFQSQKKTSHPWTGPNPLKHPTMGHLKRGPTNKTVSKLMLGSIFIARIQCPAGQFFYTFAPSSKTTVTSTCNPSIIIIELSNHRIVRTPFLASKMKPIADDWHLVLMADGD